jgi:hypothetical protein
MGLGVKKAVLYSVTPIRTVFMSSVASMYEVFEHDSIHSKSLAIDTLRMILRAQTLGRQASRRRI